MQGGARTSAVRRNIRGEWGQRCGCTGTCTPAVDERERGSYRWAVSSPSSVTPRSTTASVLKCCSTNCKSIIPGDVRPRSNSASASVPSKGVCDVKIGVGNGKSMWQAITLKCVYSLCTTRGVGSGLLVCHFQCKQHVNRSNKSHFTGVGCVCVGGEWW